MLAPASNCDVGTLFFSLAGGGDFLAMGDELHRGAVVRWAILLAATTATMALAMIAVVLGLVVTSG